MDDTSLAAWLRMREAADTQSRSAALTSAVASRLPRDREIAIVDLATGAGSNLRYLVERLPPRQRWLLVDRSEMLLRSLVDRTAEWAQSRGYEMQTDGPASFAITAPHFSCYCEVQRRDLRTLDDRTLFAGRDLVTTSALLDLVSASWLQTLAAQCRIANAAALATITYDGRFSCVPAEPEDDMVRMQMNLHQRRDKGLGGPAEGPEAAARAEHCFTREGFQVLTAASDWSVTAVSPAMQHVLIDGWAEAAAAASPGHAEAIDAWRQRRLAHAAAHRSQVTVGHRDVAAWLP